MSESVKVAVRCRPMNQREVQEKCRNVITIDPAGKTCTLESTNGGAGKVYQFDAAFGSESTTESVYEQVGSYVVEAVLDGYNSTVFAYGQTGCGKSFTMRGFVDKALEHLFEATSTSSSDTRYLALLSYLEIYNEKLKDLLNEESGTQANLLLKEDPVKGTYVAGGLREVCVKDANECRQLVDQGDRKRAAAATKMNQESSRSHAVMTLSLEAIAISEEKGRAGVVRRGRLHLVDLAGSERQSRTGALGDRLKEAASINLSLSALGNVISALAAGNGRHVPYRDSKLTRLLRDSLGGNARTLMIACLSPSDIDAEETLSTLRYAARARCIKNKPVVNEDPKDALLRQYQLELQRLRKLLENNEGVSQNATGVETKEIKANGTVTLEEVKAVGEFESKENPDVCLRACAPYDPEKEEKRRKKRELAKQEVLRRLERLTIGGEALGDAEVKRRRERRRKRLEILAEALERSAQEGNGGAFQVYGQLKSTEEALKRTAKRAKQLEAEAADLQASWDAERRDLLRRELLATQLCEAMIPHLRPGCPLRDIESVRDAATWSHELGRWRLPLETSSRIPLPPPSLSSNREEKSDFNNNENNAHRQKNGGLSDVALDAEDGDENLKNSDEDFEDVEPSDTMMRKHDTTNIADVYFKKKRIDKILAHVREAKTFEPGSRLSKSGGSEDATSATGGFIQLSSLNLQSSAPSTSEATVNPNNSMSINSYKPLRQQTPAIVPTGSLPRHNFNAWVTEDLSLSASSSPSNGTSNRFNNFRVNPPRILEALPPTNTQMPPILDASATSALPGRSH